MSGLAIESATSHVEIRVELDDGTPLAECVEDVGHGHTQRLTPMVDAMLRDAGMAPGDLKWIAVDLGPGSFTGVRVGLATAHALAMVSGARVLGASSLAALAIGARPARAIVVPLVPAGRREVYAGYFRSDARGDVRVFTMPSVGNVELVLDRVAEARAVLGELPVRFVGPGAARESAALEAAWPGSTAMPWRPDGLAAADLARAARTPGGPARGLPAPAAATAPVYVRPAQAEDTVRRRALAGIPILLRGMTAADVPAITRIERAVFPDPWSGAAFLGELRQPGMYARVAERDGRLAGYSLTWLGSGAGHLGNIAVAPDQRRRGVAAALLDDLLERARAMAVQSVTLEVRVSNADAQALYRTRGFRVAGLRRRYYRDGGEDALVMEWRVTPSPRAHADARFDRRS